MMKVVRFVLWFAPVGIFALITRVVAEVGLDALRNLLWYALTVLLAL